MTKTVFLFPGQGSQYVGMGRELLHKRDFLAPLFKKADELLQFPLTEIVFNGPAETLNQTVNAQPALLLVSTAYLEVLRYQSVLPDMVAGHSLGEYVAAVAADVLSFADALKIVRKRGELMEAAYPQGKGGMAAVLGLDAEKVAAACQEASSEGVVTIANYNCPGQLVISGEKSAVEKASLLAKNKGAKRVIPLVVSGPFHSSLMEGASNALALELEKYEFHNPKVRFFTNVEGKELTTGAQIKDTLVKQLTQGVFWEQQIKEMLKAGAGQFYEVGPGNVLSGLLRRIEKEAVIKNMEELNGLS